jgi:hypothetical protein
VMMVRIEHFRSAEVRLQIGGDRQGKPTLALYCLLPWPVISRKTPGENRAKAGRWEQFSV